MSSSEVKNKNETSVNYGKIEASLIPIQGGVVLPDGTLYSEGKIDIPREPFNGVTEFEAIKDGTVDQFTDAPLPFSNFDDGTGDNVVQCSLGAIGRKGVFKYLFNLHIEGSINLIESSGSLTVQEARPRKIDFYIDVAQNSTNVNSGTTKSIYVPFSQKAIQTASTPPLLFTTPNSFSFDCQIEWTASIPTPVQDGDDFVCRLYYRAPDTTTAGVPAGFFGGGNATQLPDAKTGLCVHSGKVSNHTNTITGSIVGFPPSSVPWSVQGSAKITQLL